MRCLILLSSLLMLMSCAAGSGKAAGTSYENDVGEYEAGEMAMSRGSLGGARARGAMALKRAPMIAADAGDAMLMDYALESETGAYQTYQRMVNYTGDIRLQSPEPEAVIDTVIQKAEARGGSVSVRRNGYVSLQIPVAQFKEFFNYILTLGQVESKNISAEDITETYTDNAARLRIAESALARLQQLLAAAKTEQEKIALLKEIQRVSEQIEQAKLREKELLRMAAFSTINLWAHNAQKAAPEPLNAGVKAFNWFSCLDCHSGDKLKLKAPQDFIEIEDSWRRWRAASASNSEFWAFEIENEPQGSVDFWLNAMLEFFKFTNYKTEIKKEENFSLIRLEAYTHGVNPVVYYIAVLNKSGKKTLKIARAKFPSIEAEKKDSEAVMEVLRRAK